MRVSLYLIYSFNYYFFVIIFEFLNLHFLIIFELLYIFSEVIWPHFLFCALCMGINLYILIHNMYIVCLCLWQI